MVFNSADWPSDLVALGDSDEVQVLALRQGRQYTSLTLRGDPERERPGGGFGCQDGALGAGAPVDTSVAWLQHESQELASCLF